MADHSGWAALVTVGADEHGVVSSTAADATGRAPTCPASPTTPPRASTAAAEDLVSRVYAAPRRTGPWSASALAGDLAGSHRPVALVLRG